jgi:hypothetical protein
MVLNDDAFITEDAGQFFSDLVMPTLNPAPVVVGEEFIEVVRFFLSDGGGHILNLQFFFHILVNHVDPRLHDAGLADPLSLGQTLIKAGKRVELFLLGVGASRSLAIERNGGGEERGWRCWMKGDMYARDWSTKEKQAMMMDLVPTYPELIHHISLSIRNHLPLNQVHWGDNGAMIDEQLPHLSVNVPLNDTTFNPTTSTLQTDSFREMKLDGVTDLPNLVYNANGLWACYRSDHDRPYTSLLIESHRLLLQAAHMATVDTGYEGLPLQMYLWQCVGNYLVALSLSVIWNFAAASFNDFGLVNDHGDVFERQQNTFYLAGIAATGFGKLVHAVIKAWYARECLGLRCELVLALVELEDEKVLSPSVIAGLVGVDSFMVVHNHELWGERINSHARQFLLRGLRQQHNAFYDVNTFIPTLTTNARIYVFDHHRDVEIIGATNQTNTVFLATEMSMVLEGEFEVLMVEPAFCLVLNKTKTWVLDTYGMQRDDIELHYDQPMELVDCEVDWGRYIIAWNNAYFVNGFKNRYSHTKGHTAHTYTELANGMGCLVSFLRLVMAETYQHVNWLEAMEMCGALDQVGVGSLGDDHADMVKLLGLQAEDVDWPIVGRMMQYSYVLQFIPESIKVKNFILLFIG